MSEKPHAAPESDQVDLIGQIINRGLEKIVAPAQPEPAEAAHGPQPPSDSKQKDDSAAPQAANRRNRSSAVYLYLLILFGAAFLMLLLAYFVQRRNSENAYSDLQNSTNSSREELLLQIRDLEQQNEALNADLSILQRQYDKLNQSSNDIISQLLVDMSELLCSWEFFWKLEQYYQAGDLQSCAAVLILLGEDQYRYSTPDGAQTREAEIVQAVFDAGILDRNYYLHPEDYSDLLEAYYAEQPVTITPIQPRDRDHIIYY